MYVTHANSSVYVVMNKLSPVVYILYDEFGQDVFYRQKIQNLMFGMQAKHIHMLEKTKIC